MKRLMEGVWWEGGWEGYYIKAGPLITAQNYDKAEVVNKSSCTAKAVTAALNYVVKARRAGQLNHQNLQRESIKMRRCLIGGSARPPAAVIYTARYN